MSNRSPGHPPLFRRRGRRASRRHNQSRSLIHLRLHHRRRRSRQRHRRRGSTAAQRESSQLPRYPPRNRREVFCVLGRCVPCYLSARRILCGHKHYCLPYDGFASPFAYPDMSENARKTEVTTKCEQTHRYGSRSNSPSPYRLLRRRTSGVPACRREKFKRRTFWSISPQACPRTFYRRYCVNSNWPGAEQLPRAFQASCIRPGLGV